MSKEEKPDGERRIFEIMGTSVLCLNLLGLGSAICGGFAIYARDFSGAGILLIASALSFGLLLLGIRK